MNWNPTLEPHVSTGGSMMSLGDSDDYLILICNDNKREEDIARLIAAAPSLHEYGRDLAAAFRNVMLHHGNSMGADEKPRWQTLHEFEAALSLAETGNPDTPKRSDPAITAHRYKTDCNCADCVAHRGYMA